MHKTNSCLKVLFALIAVVCLSSKISQSNLSAQSAEATKKGAGRDYGRSMTVTRYGIAATSQTTASAVAAQILREGGNAVDAAIAANAVLGVTEPMMNGIGGDLFAIVYQAKSGQLYGLNSSGWAPAGMTLEYFTSKGLKHVPRTIDAVTVPGAVAGWDALHNRFGKLPLSRLLAPAIFYARNGVPIAEAVASVWDTAAHTALADQPGFRETFLAGGHAPRTGEIFRDPDLAHSLELIAAKGKAAFYRGAIADKLVRFSTSQGGRLRAADLAEFEPEWVEPISTTYRGWRIFELPPNGQGIAALSMLNIMEQFPLSQYGQNSTRALHVMIEAKKLAYADLIKYIGDPRFSKIPVEQLLSKDLARRRSDSIDPGHAHCTVLPSDLAGQLNAAGKDTTYLTTIDREGNIVSLIQSNYSSFGTGLVAPGTGFALQNRGQLFSLEPNQPNTIAPRKRPLHTIIPGFIRKEDVTIGFGIMGGYNQAQAHAQFVSNLVDFGMNIQAALSAARFTKGTFDGCDVSIESRVPELVRQQLTEKGHLLLVEDPYSQTMGRGNAVMRNNDGVNFGASDPRADGEAIPEVPDWNRSQ